MDNFIPLESVRVAAPCHADWNAMTGDSRARFCQPCEKHVYNLSDMTRTEAEALIQKHEGELCVRFYRRADGTVLTDNCPVGLRAARNAVRRPLFVVGSVLAMLLMPLLTYATAAWVHVARHNNDVAVTDTLHLRDVQPFKSVQHIRPVGDLIDSIDPAPRPFNVCMQGALTTGG